MLLINCYQTFRHLILKTNQPDKNLFLLFCDRLILYRPSYFDGKLGLAETTLIMLYGFGKGICAGLGTDKTGNGSPKMDVG